MTPAGHKGNIMRIKVMLAKVKSCALVGLEGATVEVEVDISPGLPVFTIVGLPDAAVQEARERVRAAIKNSGFTFPLKRIVVNLAPADLKKAGPSYDLPIAVGIMQSRGVIKRDFNGKYLIVGELSLSGNVKPVKGAILVATKAREAGIKNLILPKKNLAEVYELQGLNAYGVETLDETIRFLNGEIDIRPENDNNLKKVKNV